MQIDLIANAKNTNFIQHFFDRQAWFSNACLFLFVDSRKKQGKLVFRQKKDNKIPLNSVHPPVQSDKNAAE